MANNKRLSLSLLAIAIITLSVFTESRFQGFGKWLFQKPEFSISRRDKFTFHDCGNRQSVIHMRKLKVAPSVFKFPQRINITALLVIDKTLEGPIRSELILRREFPYIGIVQIPCLHFFGSCAYEDICEMMKLGSLENHVNVNETNACNWVKTFGLGCSCPLKKGVYDVKDVSLALAGTILPGWLESGLYDAYFKIIQKDITVGCFRTGFSII